MLVVLNIASFVATLRLQHLACYMKLFEATQSFLCFPTQPIRHRSLLFTSDPSQLARVLEGEFQGKQELVETRNGRGETALLSACKANNPDCVAKLVEAAASMEVSDAGGETPCEAAISHGAMACAALLVAGDHQLWAELEKHEAKLGIKHLIENPSLAPKLLLWARAEGEEKVEAERRVVEGVREGFLIPGEELGEEEEAVREAAEVWNAQHKEKCK